LGGFNDAIQEEIGKLKDIVDKVKLEKKDIGEKAPRVVRRRAESGEGLGEEVIVDERFLELEELERTYSNR
jgi:hypothetical protein